MLIYSYNAALAYFMLGTNGFNLILKMRITYCFPTVKMPVLLPFLSIYKLNIR
jgi:hypothetical protein